MGRGQTQHKCERCGEEHGTRQAKYYHKKKCTDAIADNELQKTIKALEERVLMLESRPQIVHNHQEVNNNHQEINITINGFGKEDISFLTDELREMYLIQQTDGLISLIKDIHFNPQHPQNQTVILKSLKRKLASVSTGMGSFEVAPLKDVIEKMIQMSHRLVMQRYIGDAAYRASMDAKYTTCEGTSIIQDWNMKIKGICRYTMAEAKRRVQVLLLNDQDAKKKLMGALGLDTCTTN